ncbi:3'-5' exonuclease (plasmid) [Paenibacillus peoriae]|uniref:3'-5' exonuclease n=1 Tax=Paenibacillus peoriae TaxID=59893 RepID=A0A7H0YH41_9BACL|nr:3'-5' exonuclease [Paenibacillus peoriae]QNR70399.1 3'-5' exonuclease [Paenibacillus peoriae]
MTKPIYTIFDFETSGLNKNHEDQIIEIAALRTDLERDFGAIHLSVQLEEDRELSDFIKNLTGLQEADLEHGLSEWKAVEILRSFMYDTIAVAHHYPFDSSFLKEAVPMDDPRNFICTRVLVKVCEPEASASLKDVALRIGYDLTGHHRAGNDVRCTKEILKRYLPIAAERGVDVKNLIIDDKERPLSYIPDFANVYKK